ncbi:cobalt-precorrin-6A reductase [Pseudoroseomonas oryzae]|uniref:Cobalt-precorrin-6A reductase n=1 Tax=Teichococcus oryzae TaxID=1608942 RepID=A0A5B2TBE2_9PROT|nr:cobalt-precorrin-6A reductase [Pseudoroseomonas oryzae]
MRVLLLGGTTEGSALARALGGDARFQATLSLAGATSTPRAQPLPTRIGGFGGVAGLAAYLRAERVDALVDATHPFAAQMTRNAAAAAALAGTRLLRLDRSPWPVQPGDREVDSMADAAAALGKAPRRVFLAVGRKELPPFRDMAPQHHYLIRSVDPPPPELLPPGAIVLSATGPFGLEAERALLRAHRIEALVAKNSGGAATGAKLDAARESGAAVILLRRPPPLAGLRTVPDVAAALGWLHALAAERGV